MITQYGMSENLGPLTFGHDPAQPFVGRDYGMGQEYSDETAEKIDAEIRRVVDEAYEMASGCLTEHRDELDKISLLLIEKETIDRERVRGSPGGRGPRRGLQGQGRGQGAQGGRGQARAKGNAAPAREQEGPTA